MHAGYSSCLVCVSVCVSVCLCVTTNLGIYTDRHQMMGTNGISGVWRSLKKERFLSKFAIQKLWCHLHTASASVALLRIYVDGCFSIRCDIFTKANSRLSSTGNTSQCNRQQATFSFKPVFLHLSYTPVLYVCVA